MAAKSKDEDKIEIKEGAKPIKMEKSASASNTRARASESNMRPKGDLDKRDEAISARRRTGGPKPADKGKGADAASTPENDAPETKPAK